MCVWVFCVFQKKEGFPLTCCCWLEKEKHNGRQHWLHLGQVGGPVCVQGGRERGREGGRVGERERGREGGREKKRNLSMIIMAAIAQSFIRRAPPLSCRDLLERM